VYTDLLPSTSPECRFSREVLGEWLLAEVDGLQKVTVTTGMVTMSQLGEFICKGKHWNFDYYKLLSYYSNGWYADYVVNAQRIYIKSRRLTNVAMTSQMVQGVIYLSRF